MKDNGDCGLLNHPLIPIFQKGFPLTLPLLFVVIVSVFRISVSYSRNSPLHEGLGLLSFFHCSRRKDLEQEYPTNFQSQNYST